MEIKESRKSVSVIGFALKGGSGEIILIASVCMCVSSKLGVMV